MRMRVLQRETCMHIMAVCQDSPTLWSLSGAFCLQDCGSVA